MKRLDLLIDRGKDAPSEAILLIEGTAIGDKWTVVEGLTGYILRLEKVTHALDPEMD